MTDDRREATAPTQDRPELDEGLLPYELDPAAPLESEEGYGDEAAAELANFAGAAEAEDEADSGRFGAPAFAATEIPLSWSGVQAFLQACVTSTPRVTYGLGAKVPSDSSAPGRDFKKVDCSGFVRSAIRRSTDPKVKFPDGSVVQHDWVKAQGFPRGTVDDGKLVDGKIRIAFLSPQDSPSRIGHVVLIRNGRTAESHSGVGPNSRAFDGTGWQRKSRVYLLAD